MTSHSRGTNASELSEQTTLGEQRGRRECRVRVAPEAACAAKKHRRQQPRVHRINRHSLRNGFNGFLRALLGDHAWLPPSSVRRWKRLHELDACIGAPGPHDSAVRTTTVRRATIAPGDVRPSHPAPNVRDDREPPLLWERDSEKCKFDLGLRRSDLFFARGLDRFSRTRFFLVVGQISL